MYLLQVITKKRSMRLLIDRMFENERKRLLEITQMRVVSEDYNLLIQFYANLLESSSKVHYFEHSIDSENNNIIIKDRLY